MVAIDLELYVCNLRQSLRRRRKGLTLTFVQRIQMERLELILVERESLNSTWTLFATMEDDH